MARLDAGFNRLYGWKHNPLYQSGAIVVACLVVLLLTGAYLLLFYRIGRPYESVAGVADQVWVGRWMRGLHRYASDAALVFALVHALRMLVQKRVAGPRAKAWASGVLLLFSFLVCGWTGYVMVWDTQAQALAVAGARLMDVLPVFSESITRTFAGDGALPDAFFFLNLFAHIALPVGLALLLWIHVSRIARPVLLPPRGLLWASVGGLFALSVILPVAMAPKADPLRVPDPIALDVFYNFWLPWAGAMSPLALWGVGIASWGALFALPWMLRPWLERREASFVQERYCTGCRQCTLDCPYDAIRMVERTGEGHSPLVALVDPDLCVSCGICAGSCAPMRVGPPERTGRDQLAEAKAFVASHAPRPETVVVVACEHGAGGLGAFESWDGSPVLAVDCAGSVHTSVMEYLVRSGFAGLMVVSCPSRDCRNREGPQWLRARMYDDREAELQSRVDRGRVRLVYAGEGERAVVAAALADFRSALEGEARAEREETIDLNEECEVVEEVEVAPSTGGVT